MHLRCSVARLALTLVFLCVFCASSGQVVPLQSNLVLHLDATTLTTPGRLSSWNDSINGFNATQLVTTSQPSVVRFQRYCLSSVYFSGNFLTIPDAPQFDPGYGAFSWAVISRETTGTQANVLSKPDTTLSDWRIGTGSGVTNNIYYTSVAEAYSSEGNGSCGAGTYAQSPADTSRIRTWLGTMNASATGDATSPRSILGYTDGSHSNWGNLLTGCNSTFHGSVGSSNPIQIGSPSYSGHVYEVFVWQGVALNQTMASALQTYAQSKYYYYCPVISPLAGASLSGYCGSNYRDYYWCTMICAAPNIMAYGNNYVTCFAGQWTGQLARCFTPCTTLTFPENSDTCFKRMVNENFTTGTSNLNNWQITPQVPAVVAPNYFNITGNALYTNAGSQCLFTTAYNYTMIVLSAPSWVNTMQSGQYIGFNFTMNMAGGVLGFVFQYQNVNNYNVFVFNESSQTIYYGHVINNVLTLKGTDTWPSPTTFIGTTTFITVNCTRGIQTVTLNTTGVTYTWNDTTYQTGSFGFLSNGVGAFDNLIANTTCDGYGSTCTDLTSGQTCGFQCAVGFFVVSGNPDRTCSASGVWSGGNLVCGPVPPVLANATFNVSEGAAANTPVGAPLNASQPSPNVALTYQIVGGNGSTLFKVGICDGQIRLKAAGVLDYITANVYTLIITTTPNGFAPSAINSTFTIDILYVNKPPIFNDTFTRTVYENQSALATFGSPIAVIDPNAVVYPTTSFITFSILNGTSGSSVFGVTPLTGLFFPLATNLDYNIAQSYEVYVMASDAQGLNASAYFTIEILYVNKPPTLSNLTYTVQDIYANGGYSFSPPLNSIDPQSGSVYYWLLSGPSAVALDPYSGVISLTSALSDGSYLLTVMLNDTIGMSSMTYITISVVPVGPPSLIGIGLPPSGFAVTSGFDAITLQGSNFLPTANFTASYSNAYASFNASYCVFNSSTVVTCYTSPGFGASLSWVLYENGVLVQRPAGYSPLYMSYFPPSNLALSQYSGIPASDSTILVNLTGSNLYNQCTDISVVVGGAWVWTPVPGQCSFTSITLRTGGGGGGGLSVNVSIGNNWAILDNTVTYLAPVITGLIASGPLPTYGGGVVTVQGQQFGPMTSVLVVTYGNGSDGNAYTPACVHQPSGNSSIDLLTCTAGYGCGFHHTWVVCLMGQCSNSSSNTTSYAVPIVTSITGAGAIDANTAGGQQVVLTGSSFGPAILSPIQQVSYGKTGVEIIARSCVVVYDTSVGSEMTCITAEGTGAGLVWIVNIAGQPSAPFNGTSYAPPSIAYFSGAGAIDANTTGNQTVVITGDNFGPALITGRDLVYYTLSVTNVPSTSLPVTAISPQTNGTVVFYPSQCNVTVANTEIQCLSAHGAGKNLQWTIVVNGQANQAPITFYAPPSLTSVVTSASLVTPVGTHGVRTDGNVSLLLNGANFGPASSPLVQWVRVTSAVQDYAVTNYTVLSDSQINVTVAPGIGKNLSFTVRVADQDCGIAPVTFDYLSPQILLMSPNSGPTFSTTPIPVLITGTNFGLSAGATIVVQIGNSEDGTISSWLPTQPVYPAGDDGSPKQRVNETIQFLLPAGVGVSRAVRVIAYPSVHTSLAVSSNPAADGVTAFFTYQPPVLNAVVSAVLANSTTDDAIAQQLLGSSVNLFTVRKISLFGSNFGSLAVLELTEVGFFVDSQPYNSTGSPIDALWVTTAMPVYTWVDNAILCYTVQQSAFVRARLVVKEYGTGKSINITSNYGYYEDVSPEVVAIVSGNDAPTAGGSILVVTGAYLDTTVSLVITIDGQNCPIINPNTLAIVPADQVGAMLFTVFAPGLPLYNVSCIVPEGQGGSVPIILTRDNSFSNPYPFAYAAPVVDSITVVDNTIPPPNTVNSPPSSTQYSPTSNGVMILYGDNFGLAPIINMTNGVYYFLIAFNTSSPLTVNATHNHTVLSFNVPNGEGGLWKMYLTVADQSYPTPIAFSYLKPTILAIYSNSSTAGDGTANITGLNFGVHVPGYPLPSIVLSRADGKTFQCIPGTNTTTAACENPIVYRDSFTIMFVAPPGAGSQLTVTLTVAGLSYTTPLGMWFAYGPPVIESMIAVGVGPAGANVTVNETDSLPRPLLLAPAAGGYELQLLGRNFGPYGDTSCIFVTWQGAQYQPICNQVEDFVGEGNIHSGSIIVVNQTLVRFIVPPGLGTHDIMLEAYDQFPIIPGQLQYEAPVLTDLSTFLFPTDTGIPFQLLGKNFGPPTVSPSTFSPQSLPLTDVSRPTTALLYITFGQKCAVQKCIGATCLPAAVSGCVTTAIGAHDDQSITMTSLTGIGTNVNISIGVYELVFATSENRFITSGDYIYFSYEPPSVESISPQVLAMDSRLSGYELQIQGYNIGLSADLVLPNSSFVEIFVDGLECPSSQRTILLQPDNVQLTLLECFMNVTVVGHHSLALFAALQQGPTLPASAFNSLMVVCSANYYALAGNYCLPCPDGAACAGYVNNQLTLPVPLPGFYNLNSTVIPSITVANTNETLFDLCPDARGIVGRADETCVVPCQPTGACLGSNLCAVGYRDGPPLYRCSLCADNYYHYNGDCVKCPANAWILIVLFIIVAILLCIGGWVLNRKNVNIAFLSIGVDYFQVLAMFANSKVLWPPFVMEVFHILSAFNFNIDLTAPECSLKSLSYSTKWWASMQLPVAALVVFGIIFLSNLLYKRIWLGVKKRAKLMSHKNALIGMFFVMFYFLYLYLTRTVFDIFNCAPTNPPDGHTYLQVQFVQCGTGFQKTLAPFAVLYLIAYSIGYPAFVTLLLYRNRLKMMEDQLLRAKGMGETRLTNPHCYDFRKKYHKLYYQFKPDTYFWIICVIVRKFCIAVFGLLLRKNTTFQLSMMLLVLFIAYALQVRYRPYMSPEERQEVLREHAYQSLRGGIHAHLAILIKEVESKGRKAARQGAMTVTGNLAYVAAATILGYLFNYNTVEMVLLFCCCLICLCGIMFESGQLQTASFQTQTNAITALCIFVIFFSIIYFVSVVVAEVYIVSKQNKAVKAPKDGGPDKPAKKSTAFLGRWGSSSKLASVPKHDKNSLEMRGFPAGGDVEMTMPEMMNLKTESNPLFQTINVKGEALAPKLAGRGTTMTENPLAVGRSVDQEATNDAIATMLDPPSKDAWDPIRESYISLVQQVDALSKEVSALKRQDIASSMLSPDSPRTASMALLDSVRGPAAIRARTMRKTFKPTSGGASEGVLDAGQDSKV